MSNNFHVSKALGFVGQISVDVPAQVIAKRAPTGQDHWPLGTVWIEPVNTAGTAVNGVWIATSVIGGVTNWANFSGGAGVFTSLTVNPGPVNLVTVGSGAVNIGNAANASAITINTGPGNFVLLGNGNHVHLADDAAANLVSLGSVTAGAQTIIAGGAGTGIGGAAIVLETDAAGDIQIGAPTHTGTIFVGTTTAIAGESIYVGASVAPNTVIVGSTNGAALTQVQAGTGGLSLNAAGNLSAQAALGNAASPTAAVTVNHRLGIATFTGFTTANAGVTQAFTINSNKILANSGIFCTVTHLNASTNGALLRIEDITQAVGSIVVTVSNNGAGALGAGDDVLITFWVVD